MRAVVHWIFAILVLIIGLLLVIGGAYLAYLGGSLYYVLAGAMLLLTAWLVIRRNAKAPMAYSAILIATVAWSVFEAGFDFFALLPRLASWLALGLYFLTPWYRDTLQCDKGDRIGNPTNRWWIGGPSLGGLGLLVASTMSGYVQNGTGTDRGERAELASDWRHYGSTEGGTRFAAIEQINRETVGQLEEVWRYRTGLEEDFKATPLAVEGKLYLCGAGNVMIALDAETGKEMWRYDPQIERVDTHQYAITCRGVAYHEAGPDYAGDCPARIITATVAASLIAVDAETGLLCEGFGNGGVVDLREGIGPHEPNQYYHTSPPTVAGDNLVVGGLVLDVQDLGLPSGVVRAYDATTGELSWAWDVGNPSNRGAPDPGERYTPGTPNVWTVMSYDPELDLVFAPTGNANPDYFGGVRRPFDEEFSSAVVAINGTTGETRWTFQTVHHDIWDFDVPAQPVSVDVTKDAETIPALAIPTKMGQIFLLDRRDGSPVAPIEERPVPQSPELGEYLSPTQPFSSLPNFHPYRHEKDMWGLTPIDQMVCRIDYKRMRYEGMYTPPTKDGSLVAPGNFGGFNWGSVSVDADNGLLIAAPMLLAHRLLLVTPEQVAEAGPIAGALLGDNHPAVQLDPDRPPSPGDPADPFNHDQILYYGLPMPFMAAG